MRSFHGLHRRIDVYLRAVRKRFPQLSRLPHVVVRPEWRAEGDELPSVREWQRFERGELVTTDWPGYAEQNAAYLEAAREMRVHPKVYAFDADAVHEEGVREHEARVLEWNMVEDFDLHEKRGEKK